MGVVVIDISDEDIVLIGQCMDETKRRLNDLSVRIQAQITAQEQAAKTVLPDNVINFAAGPVPEIAGG